MTTATPMTDKFGIGYGGDEFAGTTATMAERQRLARIANVGGQGAYKYRRPRPDDEDADPMRPCNYPLSLDLVLRGELQHAETWDQARAIVQMKACQIAQTKRTGRGIATADEHQWAELVDSGSRAQEQFDRVPGTCRGCNSAPCRCWA